MNTLYMKTICRHASTLLLLVAGVAIIVQSEAQTNTPGFEAISNSTLQVGTTVDGANAYVSRTVLTSDELAAPFHIAVSLPMRNAAQLRALLNNHGRPSQEQMDQSYYPKRSDYLQIAQWLTSQGLAVGPEDPCHLAVPATGSVAGIASALQVKFAKVTTSDGEFTSAVTAPVIPTSIRGLVMGVHGLQPHIRAKAQVIPCNNQMTASSLIGTTTRPPSYFSANGYYMTPSDIRAAFNVPSSLTGAGQTVAIIMDAGVWSSDVATWYSWVTNSSSWSGSLTSIQAGSSLPPQDNTNPDIMEANLDVEAVAGIAPNAAIRLYEIPQGLTAGNIEIGLAAIINDIRTNNVPVTTLSMSFGQVESSLPTSDLNLMDSYFMTLASLGVTNIASSGDYGAYGPNGTGGLALGANYPASDPYVTAVGGTTIHTDIGSLSQNTNYVLSNANVLGQTVFTGWSGPGGGQYASSGGVSSFWPIPPWQIGNGTVLAGQTMRCVPDICGPWGLMINHSSGSESTTNISWGGFFGILFTNDDEYSGSGQTKQIIKGVFGTSVAAPAIAGVVALINQNRGSSGPIGYLNPYLYQIGDNYSVNGITWQGCTDLGSSVPSMLVGATTIGGPVGTVYTYTSIGNGYSPSAGYDLASGLGYPNATNLINLLHNGVTIPNVASQNVSVGATAVFTAFAEINPYLKASATYQWYRNGGLLGGATGPQLLLSSASTQSGNSGDTYFCKATLSPAPSGSPIVITSSTGTLTVTNTTNVGHLINLSTRGYLSSGGSATGGFVVGGSGAEPILIRADGPALNQFGLSGLPDPKLVLQTTSGTTIGSNFIWGGSTTLSNAFSALGAFAWSSSSYDSALLCTPSPSGIGELNVGNYTATVTSNSGGNSGVYEIEMYDANPAIPATWSAGMPHLINISTLANVGTGSNVLIGGFVVGGSTNVTLLVRATGPSLSAFGVPNLLSDPQITLTNVGGTVLVANEVWANNPTIASEASAVGAFAWPATSNDSAVICTLPPGNYTATVTGATNDTGEALLEIYVVP